jgi:hypothetical protein
LSARINTIIQGGLLAYGHYVVNTISCSVKGQYIPLFLIQKLL